MDSKGFENPITETHTLNYETEVAARQTQQKYSSYSLPAKQNELFFLIGGTRQSVFRKLLSQVRAFRLFSILPTQADIQVSCHLLLKTFDSFTN